jgi:hypothetical protein
MANRHNHRLMYGSVARGPAVVLAEYADVQGDFRNIAVRNIPQPDSGSFTFTHDGYTYNYLKASGYSECSAPLVPSRS